MSKKRTKTVVVPKKVWEAWEVDEGLDDPLRAVRDGEASRVPDKDREAPPNFDEAVVDDGEP